MPGRDARPARTKLPWGLLGALALVVPAERWVDSHPLDYRGVGSLVYESPARLSRQSAGYGLIALGDSQLKHGLVPAALERRLGRPTVNLAATGGFSTFTYYLMRRAFDGGARPSALVVDFNPVLLQSDPKADNPPLARALGTAEALDLAWQCRDPVLFARMSAERFLASLTARAAIRLRVKAALGGSPGSGRDEVRVVLRNWRVNAGAWLQEVRPDAATVALHSDEGVQTKVGPWFGHPVYLAYLRRTLDFAAARGVPVYWVVPPMHPRLQRYREDRGWDAPYDAMIGRALARYPNLTVVDGRRSGFPARHYTDAVHLDVEGAYHFSAALAGVIAARSEAPPAGPGERWVQLPAYRGGPVDLPLEDVSRSRLALGAAGRLR